MAEKTRHRFGVLDSLRGVCACMVVIYHFQTSGYVSNTALIQNSFLFVDFFFVLSGFVIAASYGDKLANAFSIKRFMLLRLGRIYPLHFVVLLVWVAFEIFVLWVPRPSGEIAFTGNYQVKALVAHLFLVQPFFGEDLVSWNGLAWSIAVELWAYLIFAFGFRFLGKWIVPFAIVLAISCTIYLPFVTDRYLNVFHHGAFARCLIGFSLGVVMFYAYRRFPFDPRRSTATVLEIAAVVGTATMIAFAGAGPFSLLVPPLFAIVIIIFAQQSGLVSNFMLLSFPQFLGKISYSIYMVHMFIVYRAYNMFAAIQNRTGDKDILQKVHGKQTVGATPLMGDAFTLGMLAVVIIVAYISYSLVEAPANEWTRRKLLRRVPSAAV
ncbi:acyltransferase [Sphingomonas aliaeris]|uniref:Acyltransferase n=1 Tax=Sphingomonas aliaeris TaxID=2759526 RepID=A0A974NXH1_9SPHN|nr:acyltransferase [Sphingomonas aliaeris]QQV78735.1 acyltransferase [Sphingomonas aliaeris]